MSDSNLDKLVSERTTGMLPLPFSPEAKRWLFSCWATGFPFSLVGLTTVFDVGVLRDKNGVEKLEANCIYWWMGNVSHN